MAKYTNEEFIAAVEQSTSIAQVLVRLGLKAAGGNYQTVKNKIKELSLSDQHFTGQGWSLGTTQPTKRPIEDYLSNKFKISSYRLKSRLLRENILDAKCYVCGNVEWLGKPIPLELEHINGKHLDNSLENLTLLCPNCHAQTPTYRGKNIGKAV